MKKLTLLFLAVAVLATSTGCPYLGGHTNLAEVAKRSGMSNVTTGDGTFENYVATSHNTGLEIGFGFGLGFLKLGEFWPARTSEDLLTDVATEAKQLGGDAMINVVPEKSFFVPIIFPGFGIGVYVDSASGTGIKKTK